MWREQADLSYGTKLACILLVFVLVMAGFFGALIVRGDMLTDPRSVREL